MTYSGCHWSTELNSVRLRQVPTILAMAGFKDGASEADSPWLGMSLWSGCAAAAKSLQSCPTLCDPIPGILQARILEWVAISFSNP